MPSKKTDPMGNEVGEDGLPIDPSGQGGRYAGTDSNGQQVFHYGSNAERDAYNAGAGQARSAAVAEQNGVQDLSPDSQATLNSFQNGLLRGSDQQSRIIMDGTQNAANVADQSSAQANEQQSLGGGGIDGMTAAIGQKAQKNFAKDQGALQQRAKFQGQISANQNVSMAAANAVAIANAQRGVESSLLNLSMQASQARYQAISGLMQGAGSIAGGYMGSQRSNGQNMSLTYGQPGSIQSVYNSSPSSSGGAYSNEGMGDYGSAALTPANEGMGNYGQSGGF